MGRGGALLTNKKLQEFDHNVKTHPRFCCNLCCCHHWIHSETLFALLVHSAVHPDHNITHHLIHFLNLSLIQMLILLLLQGETHALINVQIKTSTQLCSNQHSPSSWRPPQSSCTAEAVFPAHQKLLAAPQTLCIYLEWVGPVSINRTKQKYIYFQNIC